MNRADYSSLLQSFKSLNYTFSGFFPCAAERAIVLRHDIDFCVPSALELARLEAKAGVQATYFFMLSSQHLHPVIASSSGDGARNQEPRPHHFSAFRRDRLPGFRSRFPDGKALL